MNCFYFTFFPFYSDFLGFHQCQWIAHLAGLGSISVEVFLLPSSGILPRIIHIKPLPWTLSFKFCCFYYFLNLFLTCFWSRLMDFHKTLYFCQLFLVFQFFFFTYFAIFLFSFCIFVQVLLSCYLQCYRRQETYFNPDMYL